MAKASLFIWPLLFFLEMPHANSQPKCEMPFEIRFSVKTDTVDGKNIQLFASLINGCDFDVYMPGLLHQIINRVHISKKIGGLYQQLKFDDVPGHGDLLRPIPPPMPPDRHLKYRDSLIDIQRSKLDLYLQSDSVLADFKPLLSQNKISLYHLSDYPVFLRAGEYLDNLVVGNITKAFSSAGEYQIEFNYDISQLTYKHWPCILTNYWLIFPEKLSKISTIIKH